MFRLAAPAALLLALAAPAVAAAPPPGALPLSQVLAAFEAEAKPVWIEDVSWDDDGYWEVDYHTVDGRELEVKLDPTTGKARQ